MDKKMTPYAANKFHSIFRVGLQNQLCYQLDERLNRRVLNHLNDRIWGPLWQRIIFQVRSSIVASCRWSSQLQEDLGNE
jgi:hypothetical protein